MTLGALRALIESGRFHHATYRNFGSLWEGLHVYAKSEPGQPLGFRGYVHVGAFYRDNPDLASAEALARGTGVSAGAYGAG